MVSKMSVKDGGCVMFKTGKNKMLQYIISLLNYLLNVGGVIEAVYLKNFSFCADLVVSIITLHYCSIIINYYKTRQIA